MWLLLPLVIPRGLCRPEKRDLPCINAQRPSLDFTWRFYKAWCQWQWDLTINHVYSAYFHYFPQWVIFGKTLAKSGLGQYPQMSWRASQSVPAISSHLLISWKMSPLKPVPQEELRTGKTSEMSGNVPEIYSDTGKCLQEVLAMYH